MFGDVDLGIGTYRRSVSEIIPEMTRVALLSKRADIVRDTPNFSEKRVLYWLSRTEFFCFLPWLCEAFPSSQR